MEEFVGIKDLNIKLQVVDRLSFLEMNIPNTDSFVLVARNELLEGFVIN